MLESVFGFSEPGGTFSTPNRYPVMKNFYVYYSFEEWGRGYIGSRGCQCLPEEDVKYFGTFSDKFFCPTNKIILGTFLSRGEALEAEALLHNFFKVDKNPHFANKAKQTSNKFSYDVSGEFWVTDGVQEQRLKNGCEVPESYRKGRMLEFKQWYTNGHDDLWLTGEDEVPEGFRPGRTSMSGENNSQYGVKYRWINDGCTNRKLQLDIPTPQGWEEGQLKSEEGTLSLMNGLLTLLSDKYPDGRSKHSVKAGLARGEKMSIPVVAISPDGEEFDFLSITDASSSLGVCMLSVKTRAKNGGYISQGPRKGWRFRFK